MKPICKAEARWLFWRSDHPGRTGRWAFDRFEKSQMNRAKRRYFKRQPNASGQKQKSRATACEDREKRPERQTFRLLSYGIDRNLRRTLVRNELKIRRIQGNTLGTEPGKIRANHENSGREHKRLSAFIKFTRMNLVK